MSEPVHITRAEVLADRELMVSELRELGQDVAALIIESMGRETFAFHYRYALAGSPSKVKTEKGDDDVCSATEL